MSSQLGRKASVLAGDSNKPDIIVGTETWLTTEIHDNEIFPLELGYTIYRRDRIDKIVGGSSSW